MPHYAITERAGPFVAAHRNTGVGTVLELSERQAEHELRLGTLVALPVAAVATTEPSGDDVSQPAAKTAEADVTVVDPDTEAVPFPTRKTRRLSP